MLAVFTHPFDLFKKFHSLELRLILSSRELRSEPGFCMKVKFCISRELSTARIIN